MTFCRGVALGCRVRPRRWGSNWLLTKAKKLPSGPFCWCHNVLLYQPRLVATDQFRWNDEQGGISRIARLEMNVMLPIKISKIR